VILLGGHAGHLPGSLRTTLHAELCEQARDVVLDRLLLGASVSAQFLVGPPVLTLVIPTRGRNVRFILLFLDKYPKT